MQPYRDLATYDGSSDFEGSIGKVVRAKYQLNELQKRFSDLSKSHPYTIVGEFKPRPGEKIGDYWFRVGTVSIPKREWGVLIGEVVHNLRSALDQAIYAAAKDPSRDTQFPIFTLRKDWEKKSCGMVYSVPEDALRLIEEAQPYHAPEPRYHVLAILNRLSNQDKHRLLHTALLRLEGMAPGFRADQDIGGIDEIEPFLGPLKEGAKLARIGVIPDGPEPKMSMYGEFALSVTFEDPRIARDAEVFETLRLARSSVEAVVTALEFTCRRS